MTHIPTGTLRSVWTETWPAIWEPLSSIEGAPEDLLLEIYRSLMGFIPAKHFRNDAISDTGIAEVELQKVVGNYFTSERRAIAFLEAVPEALDEFEQAAMLREKYSKHLSAFFSKFNVGYEVVEDFSITPKITTLLSDILRAIDDGMSPELKHQLDEIKVSLRNSYFDPRHQQNIKQTLNQLFILLEGTAKIDYTGKENTLGDLCDTLNTFPHKTISESLKKLHGFRSDYPGIAHAGNQSACLRNLEYRDLAALVVILYGFSAYANRRCRVIPITET